MHTLQKSSTCGASGAPPLTMKRTLQQRKAGQGMWGRLWMHRGVGRRHAAIHMKRTPLHTSQQPRWTSRAKLRKPAGSGQRVAPAGRAGCCCCIRHTSTLAWRMYTALLRGRRVEPAGNREGRQPQEKRHKDSTGPPAAQRLLDLAKHDLVHARARHAAPTRQGRARVRSSACELSLR